MASDKGFEDPVASECHDGAVVRVRLVIIVRVRFESVVESGGVVVYVDGVEFCGCHHLSKVPQFHCLILSIGENVSTVALAVNVGKSFSVTHEDTSFTSVSHGTSVPDSQCTIIRAGVEDVRR